MDHGSLTQGTKANYIVAQATFREGADEQEEEEEAQEDEEENVEGEGEGEDEEDKLPESKWQPPMKIPSEERGSGTNKFTFFVCNKVINLRRALFLFVFRSTYLP